MRKLFVEFGIVVVFSMVRHGLLQTGSKQTIRRKRYSTTKIHNHSL